MTGTPQESDLGLNLVFESAVKSTPSSGVGVPSKKRKNKYDRRREKGRLAKLAKASDLSKPDVGENHVGSNSVLSNVNLSENKGSAKNNKSNRKPDTQPSKKLIQPCSSRNEEKTDDSKNESVTGAIKTSSIEQSNHDSKQSGLQSNASNDVILHGTSSKTEANQLISSRRNRAQTNLSDDTERARYLSEFHARPRDLDRNENASKEIKTSVASDHIFDHGYVDMCAKEDNDENDNPFSKLGLDRNIVRTISNPDGYFKLSQLTIIQFRAIKALLPSDIGSMKAKRAKHNLFIQSETGSGKTLAYLLPILQHLAVDLQTHAHKKVDRQIGGTRAILLMPTRELSTQTYNVVNQLCSKSFPWIVPGCLSGGEKRKSEKARLRRGITILIATPGRLLDHLSKTESLMVALKGKLEWFVLDEADRLLDSGLGGQVEQIVQHLRSNQPRAGAKKDGVTWRSILVSATVTSAIEELAKTTMGGEDWKWARGHNDNSNLHSEVNNQVAEKLVHSAPRQLAQLYMVVSAKLRLTSLIAFLAARASKGERTVVFMSTCDGVDYHHSLFTSMSSIFAIDDIEDNGGIFGKSCPCFKLHGGIPQAQRLDIINQFSGSKISKQKSAILLATDVAARGLNIPSLDWIVQYDPPCETNDYIHRAGRSARAGKSGHSLIFLLPSERQYIEVLQLRGLKDITALSLSTTLVSAATLCPSLLHEGDSRSSGKVFSFGRGEDFTLAIQNRLEQCVIQDDADYKASIENKVKDAKQRRRAKKDVAGPLLIGARKAFSAFVRAYPAKEKAVKHIFNARGLHLGHIARSLALRETPKMVSKENFAVTVLDDDRDGKQRKSKLTFNTTSTSENEKDKRILSVVEIDYGALEHIKKRKKDLNTRDVAGGKDIQHKMMEQAIRLQNQGLEFM